MWKTPLTWLKDKLHTLWCNWYFSWQLKDKASIIVLSFVMLVLVALPTMTYQLVQYKNTQREIKCLALNIFHEARSESHEGQFAVASVTLNRLESKHYPDTVCDVVYEKRWDRIRERYVGQFSWTELKQPPPLKSAAWKKAWEIAKAAYYNKEETQLNGALFYHATYVKPSWASHKKPIAKIDNHIFYR